MKKLGWFLLGAISLLALQALAASLVLVLNRDAVLVPTVLSGVR